MKDKRSLIKKLSSPNILKIPRDGRTGNDGYTPVKGVDYFDGANGYTPIKGVDYFDGKDGRTPIPGVDFPIPKDGDDGREGHTPIPGIDFPIPKNGKDGRDGIEITPDQIITKINTTKDSIESYVVKGLPTVEKIVEALKSGKLLELRDIKGARLDMSDQRWHGSGSSSGYVTLTGTETLTNKRITKRTGTTSSSATPTINTDNVDFYSITALSTAITSFTTNLSGTPTEAQILWLAITDNGTARAISWGSSFEASTIALPTTTVTSTRLDVGFVYNTVTSKWRCVASC